MHRLDCESTHLRQGKREMTFSVEWVIQIVVSSCLQLKSRLQLKPVGEVGLLQMRILPWPTQTCMTIILRLRLFYGNSGYHM